MKGFHNVLQLLSNFFGKDYNDYLRKVSSALTKTLVEYEIKFGFVRLQRRSNPSLGTGKKKIAWGKIW